MKDIIFVCFLVSATSLAYGQPSQLAKIGDKNVSPGIMLYELHAPPPEARGTTYLDTAWHTAVVILSSNLQIRNYPVRYDLKNDLLEINTGQGVKVINNHLIQSFSWKNASTPDSSRFVNSKLYPGTTSGDKIMQVLVEGNTVLLKYVDTFVQPSNYNAALDVGMKTDQIKSKATYYLSTDNQLLPLHLKLKKNKGIFKSDYGKIVGFAKENKLNLRREPDLIKIIHFYNSL